MGQALGESGTQQHQPPGSTVSTAPAGAGSSAQQAPAAPVVQLTEKALATHEAVTQPQGAVPSIQADHQGGLHGLSCRVLSHAPSRSDGAATILVREDEPGKDDVGSAIETIRLDAQPRIVKYFEKWLGDIDTAPPVPHPIDLFCSWLGAFLGIMFVSLIAKAMKEHYNQTWLLASFGASAVLIFGVPESKLAQPRNLIGGQVISALCGVFMHLAFRGTTDLQWLSNALGMSLALLAMQLTRTTHPPGGATALIACTSPADTPWAGFQLVVAVALGSVVMMLVAIIVNNVPRDRAYPTYWIGQGTPKRKPHE